MAAMKATTPSITFSPSPRPPNSKPLSFISSVMLNLREKEWKGRRRWRKVKMEALDEHPYVPTDLKLPGFVSCSAQLWSNGTTRDYKKEDLAS
jgi:hypothetical protein